MVLYILALGPCCRFHVYYCNDLLVVESSAPSTPSVRSNTPVAKVPKGKGRGKGGSSPRVRTSTSMKKALSAAEIAGTNAAYAAVGISPSNSKGMLYMLTV